MSTNPLTYALLAELLAALEADGALPGTDQHLRIQELLRLLPPDAEPVDLKTWLAPVLCKNKDEQERFYELFERSWKQVQQVGVMREIGETPEGIPVQQARKERRWNRLVWVATGILALLGAWLIRQIFFQPPGPRLTRTELNLTTGDTFRYRFDTLAEAPEMKTFGAGCLPADSACIAVHIDSAAFFVHIEGLRAGIDSVCLDVETPGGKHRLHTVMVYVTDRDTSITPPPSDAPPDTALYVERPIPYPIDRSKLLPAQPTQLQQALLDYEWPIKAFIILLTGFLCWFLARWIERKRRKLIAEHQPNSKPPYTWDIRLDDEPELAYSERYYGVLHQLRQREQDEARRLDMRKTVKATIAKAGMPQIRYTQLTRPAEYLLLLDRQGARNHRAQLFNLLYKAFSRQEVIIERYYYEGDPRLCHNEKHPEGVGLRDLLYRHPQARLLLLGDGLALLNPQTGRLAKWTQLFAGWTDRALLSSQPPGEWGRRERALQEQFLLLPAALSGLQAAIQHFDDLDAQAPDITPRQFPDANWAPIQLQSGGLIATLEHYFVTPTSDAQSATPNPQPANPKPANLLHWIAACAVYPELHWDLTLYIGQLLSSPDHNLLSLENIAQLCRLPWFVAGEMPLEARKTLLGWLETEHPDTLQHVRAGLHRLLLHNPPPRDSAAHDDFAMNMALNEWLFTKDNRRKQELEQQIAARLAGGQQADFTVVKVLDRPRSPLDFVVPDAWKKYVYTKGSRLLGARAWVWLLPLWLALSGLLLGWSPAVVQCPGETGDYAGQPWCLETGEELVQYWEMMALDTLAQGDTLVADSLVKRILLTDWQNWALSGGELRNMFLTQPMRPGGDTSVTYSGSLREVPFDEVRARFNMLNLVRGNAAVPAGSAAWIDSVACLQNLAVAYFNAGVKIRQDSAAVLVPTPDAGGLQPDFQEEKACFFFRRAELLNKMLPDTLQLWYVRDAAKACPEYELGPPPDIDPNSPPPPPPAADIVLRGRILDAETKAPLPADLTSKITITAKGLPNGRMVSRSGFEVKVPGDWSSAVVVTVEAPGYEAHQITLQPNNLSRVVQFLLQPDKARSEEALSQQLRWEGMALLARKDYQQAIIKFQAAWQLTPERNELGRLIDEAQKELAAQQNEQQAQSGKKDRDGDGVPDKEDKCPDEAGSPANGGCKTTAFSGNAKPLPLPLRAGGSNASCYDNLVSQAVSAYNQGNYSDALQKLTAAKLCADAKSSQELDISILKIQRILSILLNNKAMADNDGDTVPDFEDKCPSDPGDRTTEGCPSLKAPEFNMLPIPGGAFLMGCNRKTDDNCDKDALPEHKVTINGFYLSTYEVTQAQWKAVMGSNPSYFSNCDNCPVEQVSWYDIQDFLTKLNEKTGKKYRLPTEAEWEYAARGGNKSRGYRYAGSNNLDAVAWYAGNAGGKSHPVGGKQPNELGLYDMTGNVWEWCSDWYDAGYYSKSPGSNPPGPPSGSRKVLRGCSWDIKEGYCGVAFRSSIPPRQSYNYWGFRLALDESK